METGHSYAINKYLRLCLCVVLLITIVQSKLAAQNNVGSYTIKNNRMYIKINKTANPVQLNDFIKKYNLSDIPLKMFMETNSADSLKKLGWTINFNDAKAFIISKAVMAFDEINNPADK